MTHTVTCETPVVRYNVVQPPKKGWSRSIGSLDRDIVKDMSHSGRIPKAALSPPVDPFERVRRSRRMPR